MVISRSLIENLDQIQTHGTQVRNLSAKILVQDASLMLSVEWHLNSSSG